MRMTRFFVLFLIVAMSTPALFSQGRKEKKQARIEESAKPKNVAGGVKWQAAKSYQDSYDAVLNWIKRADYTIESADRDTGQVVTAMSVTGGYNQTGTRLMVTLIKDNETATTLKVAVTEQKRKKLLSTEPWSDPKVNEKESQKVADQLKTVFQ